MSDMTAMPINVFVTDNDVRSYIYCDHDMEVLHPAVTGSKQLVIMLLGTMFVGFTILKEYYVEGGLSICRELGGHGLALG